MLTLGIWAFGRDSSAVLVDDTSIVAAIEEERLIRSTGMDGIPRMAISRCLEQRNAKITDVQLAAFPRRPALSALREAGFRLRNVFSGSRAAWAHALGRNFREVAQVRQIRRLYGATSFDYLVPHLCLSDCAYLSTAIT